MAGTPSKLPIDRIHRAYREGVVEFCEAYGFDENWIATHFEQFAFMRIREQGMGKHLAAFMAWQDVQACFQKQGAEDVC